MTAKDDATWRKAVKKALKSAPEGSDLLQVKKLRKVVLLSLQTDEDDKASKKQFKRVVQAMEDDGTICLGADGNVKYTKSLSSSKRKSKSEGGGNDKKKQKRSEAEHDKSNDDNEQGPQSEPDSENENDFQAEQKRKAPVIKNKNRSCKGNPQGVTRLFLGNLPFAVDESSLGAFLPGEVTHIKWITDKETGKFYGSAFIEMDNSRSAADAVAMAGLSLMGREIKINFAPAREGDEWPPPKKVMSGSGQAGGKGIKAMAVRPHNCRKLFVGNLSYDIDDDAIAKFFASVGAELREVRWLHHSDTGDFKGCGFCEFWSVEACDKAATLNGKHLLGRPIRIDWTN